MQQNGATPLYVAAEYGHTESITLLLQGGAAVDAEDEVRGALLSLMSRALALLLSLSSLALFLGFISSIHAYVGSRL
jgi:ankyrin repeat protein